MQRATTSHFVQMFFQLQLRMLRNACNCGNISLHLHHLFLNLSEDRLFFIPKQDLYKDTVSSRRKHIMRQ